MPTRFSIRRFALSLTIVFISAAAQAQDRQQAALTVDEPMSNTASAHYDRVRPSGPVGTAGRLVSLQRAIAHHAGGDADRALGDYDEAIRLEPDNVTALLNRGIVLSTHRAELRKAMADFDRVLSVVSGSADALMFRGDAHMRLGDYRRALADLDRLVALAPANAQAYVLRGVARALLGQTAKAESDYAKALSLDRRNVDALVNRAAIAAAHGDPATAIRDLDTALAIDPGHALARYNRGYAWSARHDYEKAMDDYSAAIALDPRLGWAYLNRCVVRIAAGHDLRGAAADCEQARKILPDVPQVRALVPSIAREFAAYTSNQGRPAF